MFVLVTNVFYSRRSLRPYHKLAVLCTVSCCVVVPLQTQHAPTSKGCGLVVMRTYADAASAIAGLDNYKWEGMHSAMVVKLMPPQRQRQEQQDAGASGELLVQLLVAMCGQHVKLTVASVGALVWTPCACPLIAWWWSWLCADLSRPNCGCSSTALHVLLWWVLCPAGGSSYRSPGQASSSRLGPAPLPMTRSNYASGGQMRMVLGVDVAPPGCAPDAYKLFVGNIPRAYSEPDLLPVSCAQRAMLL